MNKDLITELQLPRVEILLKPITGFIKENTKEPWVEITEIIKFSINIQGYQRNILAYIMPVLMNPVIIRLPWIRENNIIIRPVTNALIINSYGLIILIKKTPVLLKIKEIMVVPFAKLVKGARKRQKPLTVFKVSLKNITKALRPKIIGTPTENTEIITGLVLQLFTLFRGGYSGGITAAPPWY